MNATVVLITIAVALPVVALTAWIWALVKRVDRDFRTELEGIHFDI